MLLTNATSWWHLFLHYSVAPIIFSIKRAVARFFNPHDFYNQTIPGQLNESDCWLLSEACRLSDMSF